MSKALPILSPTQLEKLDTCRRAWGFRYLDGLRAPQKASAANGTAIHALLERYYTDRVLPSTSDAEAHAWLVEHGHIKAEQVPDLVAGLSEIALSGTPLIPVPRDDLRVEHAFEVGLDDLRAAVAIVEDSALAALLAAWPADLRYTGKIDLYDTTRADGFRIGQHAEHDADRAGWDPFPDTLEVRGDTFDVWPAPLVLDHKTTSDISYMKKDLVLRGGEHVRGDPQPAIYGLRAVLDFVVAYGFLPAWVHFRWVYYIRKRGARARASDVRMTPAEIFNNAARWLDEAQAALDAHAQDLKAADMPVNPAGCSKFGGCEFGPPTRSGPGNLNVCRLTAGERMKAAMTTNTPPSKLSSLVNNFKTGAAPAGKGVFGAPPSPAKPAAPAPAPAKASAFDKPKPAAAPKPVSMPPQPAQHFGAEPEAPADDPMAAFAADEPPAPAVDPRLAECPPRIAVEKREAWLAHCEKLGLDHKTGLALPRADGRTPAAVIPPAREPDEVQDAAPAEDEPVSALRQEVSEGKTVLVQDAASIEAAKRKPGRPRKDPTTTTSGEGEPASAEGGTILITRAAIDELIGFLTSLKASVQ